MTEPEPLVSCLCITEDRDAFMPWLRWNFDKQDYPHRELVVVDSSRGEPQLLSGPGLSLIRCAPGTSVAKKRNMALEAAQGEFVTWFDDDDWQHPRKLALLAEALRDGRALAGNSRSWFVDLMTGRAREHVWQRSILFNSLGARRELAAGVPFDEARRRASDTPWTVALRRKAHGSEVVLDRPLFFWLCHERNLSNPTGRKRFPESLEAVRRAAGAEAWGETDAKLEALRTRLLTPRPKPAAPRRAYERVCVVITTYDRPDGLERLLDDLEREWQGPGLEVRVYDDASPSGYLGIEERLRSRGWSYHRSSVNHGKKGWWRWWSSIMADLRNTQADAYFVLQDDVRLCERFFERALEQWAQIPDPRKASLFLHLDEQTAARGRAGWTPVNARRVGTVVLCGWVDLTAFVCTRTLFERLDWRIDPVPTRRWRADALLSSGVGSQVSVRLHRRGLTMYRVDESLTVHGARPSLMNPAARQRWPMQTVRFVDGDSAAGRLAQLEPYLVASLASVPARERGLAAVIEALLPQVDRLGVYLNGYRRAPGFLEHPKIRIGLSEQTGDRGDAGKFFWADRVYGYHLLCDDDLRYPEDYAARVVAGIDRYSRRAVVGFHGSVLNREIADYYRSRRLFPFALGLAQDTPVHVLGTGVSGYHASTIAVRLADFETPSMADIWFALLGQRQQVPFVCLDHEAGWLRGIPGFEADSIYRSAFRRGSNGASLQTRIVCGHGRWVLHQPPKKTPLRAALKPPAPDRLGPIVRVPVRGPSKRVSLLLPQDDHITLAVQRSGTYYECDLLEAIRSCDVRGTYVDVGAHYGNHTLFFALECPAERVVAIEPNPTSFEGLCANLRANRVVRRVTSLPIAIHPSWSHLTLAPLPWRPRPGSPARTNSGRFGVAGAEGATPAARLDEALAPFERIALIKVDAENLGPEILASGKTILTRDHPVIAVEAATDERLRALHKLLDPLGYKSEGRFCWTPTWLWTPD